MELNNLNLPLEDTIDYVIAKAQRGQGITNRSLADKLATDRNTILAASKGEAEDDFYLRLAQALGLHGPSLLAIARDQYHPRLNRLPPGLHQLTTAYKDFSVNAYLVEVPDTGQALVFDTGTNATALLDLLQQKNRKLEMVFLTHTHRDHVMDVDKLRARTGAPLWTGHEEPWPNARTFCEGKTFSCGPLTIETRSTKGHAKGGITYVLSGLGASPVAICGDAVFAGSIGGPLVSYEDARRTIEESLFPLPEETVLAPGHGPLTTLGKEKAHNPFLAAWVD
ncbi:MAG: MBL fold metallo-hydrolase [Opitutales bacterium]|nr:MBL fold metallo-hydrolase [Opitutales bacterium]